MSKRTGRKRKLNPPQARQPKNTALIVGIIIAAVGTVGLLIFSRGSGSGGVIDPEPISYQMIDKMSLGNENAPVVMVEYSDFQCPFCGSFRKNAFPLIVENYINPGEVFYIYRNYSILGLPSFRAAKAAFCAVEQDSFWPYHDYLFVNQDETDPSAFSSESLEIFAERVGMDTNAFRECFIAERTNDLIDADFLLAGDDGVESAPSFLINGTLIRGAQEYEVFEEQIELALALAAESTTP